MWEIVVDEEDSWGSRSVTDRLKILGGWLVRTHFTTSGNRTAMVFVSDPFHEWDLEKCL